MDKTQDTSGVTVNNVFSATIPTATFDAFENRCFRLFGFVFFKRGYIFIFPSLVQAFSRSVPKSKSPCFAVVIRREVKVSLLS